MNETMGAIIARRRKELGLTQEQLAERVDVSTSSIGQIERGEKKPSAETVAALGDSLGVTADYLLRGRRNRCDQQSCALYEDMKALLGRYEGR